MTTDRLKEKVEKIITGSCRFHVLGEGCCQCDEDVEAILSLIDEEKGLERERWLGFFKEDIAHSFIPRCGGCGKIATEQTVKGKHAQESNERPCNWGYYCRKCFDEGLKIEEEAMYGR